ARGVRRWARVDQVGSQHQTTGAVPGGRRPGRGGIATRRCWRSEAMMIGLFLGAGLGASLCLLVFALVPPRPALSAAVSRWERQRGRATAAAWDGRRNLEWDGRLGRWMVAQLARRGITLNK